MFTWTCGFKRLFGRNPAEDFILGYNPRNRSWTGDFARWKAEHPDGDRVDYEAGGVEALTELVAICKQQGIEVVLVFSPVYYEGVPMISNRAEIFAEFATIAKRFDIPFWDYSESPLTREKAYFYNSQHMNSKGAALFSHDLAERLATVIRSKGSSRGSGREAATGIAESSKQKR